MIIMNMFSVDNDAQRCAVGLEVCQQLPESMAKDFQDLETIKRNIAKDVEKYRKLVEQKQNEEKNQILVNLQSKAISLIDHSTEVLQLILSMVREGQAIYNTIQTFLQQGNKAQEIQTLFNAGDYLINSMIKGFFSVKAIYSKAINYLQMSVELIQTDHPQLSKEFLNVSLTYEVIAKKYKEAIERFRSGNKEQRAQGMALQNEASKLLQETNIKAKQLEAEYNKIMK